MIVTKQDTKEQTKDSVIEGLVPPHFKDRCTLRFTSAEAVNAKGSPNFMIKFEAEILKPATVTGSDGKTYALGSLKVTYYGMINIHDKETGEFDPKKSAEGRDVLLDLNDKLGLPVELDTENPETKQYVGICFDAVLGSKEKMTQKQERNAVTGKMDYVAVKDAKGVPISQGWELTNQINDKFGGCSILGRSEEQVASNRPF